MDYTSKPTDYADLYIKHYGFIVKLINVDMGVRGDEAEDMAMEILTRFMERDFLAEFNPNHGKERHSTPMPFRNFLAAFVKTYARGHRDRMFTRMTRFPMIMDAPIRDESATTLSELISGVTSFEDELVEGLSIEQWLERIEPLVIATRTIGKIKYSDAFEVFKEIVFSDNPQSDFIARMMEKHGISSTAAASWWKRTVTQVTEHTRGIRLTAGALT